MVGRWRHSSDATLNACCVTTTLSRSRSKKFSPTERRHSLTRADAFRMQKKFSFWRRSARWERRRRLCSLPRSTIARSKRDGTWHHSSDSHPARTTAATPIVIEASARRANMRERAVQDPRRVAPIREHQGQLVGQAETPLGHREKHHAPIRGHWMTPAIDWPMYRSMAAKVLFVVVVNRWCLDEVSD